MTRDAAAVAHDVGLLLFVPAAMAAISLPVAVAVGDTHAVVPLLSTAAACTVVAAVLVTVFRHARALHRWPAVEVVALGWLTSSLVGAGVLAWVAHAGPDDAADVVYRSAPDALFEGTSALTSTGLTVADGSESHLTPIVQWWRSLLQWVGGAGVVLFAAGFGHTASRMSQLYGAEGRSDALEGDVRHSIRAIWLLYLGLTIVAILAFAVTERTWWVALNHGLTGASTGGFTVTDDSFASANAATKLVAITIMIAGATSFVAHHLLFAKRDLARLRTFTPSRAQLLWLGAGGLALATFSLTDDRLDVLDAVFEWVTAAATAGFTATDRPAAWGPLLLWLLVVAMVVGAPSGSTGGGVKLDRVVWLVKRPFWRRTGWSPTSWDGEPVDADDAGRSVRHAGEMLGLWIATLAIGIALMLLQTDAPVADVVFDTASALSNVGLDAGVAGGDLDGGAKLTLTVLMYVGRLELFAALVLASQRERIGR